MSRIERRYQFPGLVDPFAQHMAATLQDIYALGCRPVDPTSKLAHRQCRHTAIYAITLCPALGLEIFTNPDGMALPVRVFPHLHGDFIHMLAGVPAYELGYPRGEGRFMPRLEDLGDGTCFLRSTTGSKPKSAPWSSFATYYLADLDSVHFLQDGPYPGGPNAGFRENPAQSPEEWRQLCKERDAIRFWLAGDAPPEPPQEKAEPFGPDPWRPYIPPQDFKKPPELPRQPGEFDDSEAPWKET